MLKEISKAKMFGGTVAVYAHAAESTQCEMRFSVYIPTIAATQKVPQLYWLSGLTCTEDNFTVKAGAQRFAEKHGLLLIAPDTSPRGENVQKGDNYDLGLGAGFYVNATEKKWLPHYKMYDYVAKELPTLIEKNFNVIANQKSIFGHSMGGHGALIVGLKEQGSYQSISAFAPIGAPSRCPWGQKAFKEYLGNDPKTWEAYDSSLLLAKTKQIPPILVDQGTGDKFLNDQLMPEILEDALKKSGCEYQFRYAEGYDHSYFFMATFMEEHIAFHAKHLKKSV